MGKKAVAIIGSEDENQLRAKAAIKREQKKKREGKIVPEVVVPEAKVEEKVAESKKVSQKIARVRGKNYQTAKAKTDVTKSYPLSEAIKLLREISYSKASDIVELHLNLREKASPQEVVLPHATGKSKTIAVANDATVAKIEAGKIDFDILLASPAQMGKLVKFAKILGPKGLMPNPKNGTVTENPEKKAADMTSENTLTLKTEKDAPLMHLVIGKLTMNDQQLAENIAAVTASLEGKMTKIVLKSAMSPAIKVLLA